MYRRPVLIVDGDAEFLRIAREVLRRAGVSRVQVIEDGGEPLASISTEEISVVIFDLSTPRTRGPDFLPRLVEEFPRIPVVVVAGTGDVDTAVHCMKAGAFDYFVKPVEEERLLASVRRALELRELKREVSALQAGLLSPRPAEERAFHGIVTRNRKVQAIFTYLEAVAPSRQPVLITGETGVGKELVARAIHELSGCEGGFVAVNVSGLDDTLYSDTLFGHRKGAFTGADQDRCGLLGRAEKGTIFLDEIGDLEKRSQVKLLRLLEEREFYPLGSDEARRTDARVLCATHHDLNALVASGAFRRDLYYRLNAHHVHVPPLRERMEDIPLLAELYLAEAAQALGKRVPTPPAELFQLLAIYHFPGNVRELRAMIFDAVAQHRSGVLSLDPFRKVIGDRRSSLGGPPAGPAPPKGIVPFDVPVRFPTLKEAEDHLLAEALKRARNNQGVAATLLGISRSALNKRLGRKRRHGAEQDSGHEAA